MLQWTSELLVEGGRGPGSWDFVDLAGWDSGDMSGVISGMGSVDTELADLKDAVGDALGQSVRLTPSSWTFSPDNNKAWWAAPVLVVHRND